MASSFSERILSLPARVLAGLYTRLFTPFFFAVGKGCLIVPPLRYGNLNLVSLGSRVTIQHHCWFLTVGNTGKETTPKLIVGDGTTIGSNATIAAAKSVVIGKRVLFAGNVYVSDHGHAYEDVTKPICEQGIRKVGEVSIGEGSWLGQNAVVLPGSCIGKHCVIGANSVINCTIPDYCVAAGNPARIIRRYDEKRIGWKSIP